jgi:hypothetical protein
MLGIIIELIAGAIGGNVAGALLKDYDLGTLGNSIAGVVGGGIGGQLLGMVTGAAGAGAASGMDAGSFISMIAGGGVGGGVLMIIVGIIKRMMGGSSVP